MLHVPRKTTFQMLSNRKALEPGNAEAGLPRYEVIGSPHRFVGAGGMDFHFGAGNLVEKIRRTPGINQFALVVDVHAVLRGEEVDFFWILPRERRGDLRVRADGIAAKHIAVLMNDTPDILQRDFGRQFRIGESRGRHVFSRAGRKVVRLGRGRRR